MWYLSFMGSSVSEEYTARVFRELSDDGGGMIRTISISDDLVSVWKDTISMLFGLK